MTQRTHLTLLTIFFGLLVFFFSTFVSAAPQNTLNMVQHTAEEYVKTIVDFPPKSQLTVKAANLDSRLKLTICPEHLESSVPGKQSLTGNVTVLVSCRSESWQVYVPVRIQLLLPRVVATKPLARGVVLSASDLAVQMVETRFQRGVVFEHPQQIIGSKVKRNVNMGDAIQGSDICLVCRNDSVLIKAGRSGLNIVTKGTALSDGSLGEQIRVQNTKSKRVVDGTITGVGEVTVNF
ncbi:flagellar basal body P-ring formation chaperone FlgA [Photobacterium chitinilyticum]|uniref:Flagella basal body P-ring formation protein FlgA n=1 Tax=Photobacterium chitinilyticum TaxID=2485123 RepID=A0A444JTR8_9GAMM|nr:flagellar basal body P-ring formation chaperone FlgA [Photobacterium chitinilyticum]RWX56522.1 flagella basal body P-ring formation protein FlgA [Photobacterium chitinilyticum]